MNFEPDCFIQDMKGVMMKDLKEYDNAMDNGVMVPLFLTGVMNDQEVISDLKASVDPDFKNYSESKDKSEVSVLATPIYSYPL